MKQYLPTVVALLLSSFVGLVGLTGCAESTPTAVSAPAEITRDAAVSAARQDAQSRALVANVSTVAVSRSGRYWVVDLRGKEGGGVHYAIAFDGSIRERRVVQW